MSNSSNDINIDNLVIPKDTLDYLKIRFPVDTLFDPSTPMETIRVAQGRLEVIRELQRIYENQRREF